MSNVEYQANFTVHARLVVSGTASGTNYFPAPEKSYITRVRVFVRVSAASDDVKRRIGTIGLLIAKGWLNTFCCGSHRMPLCTKS